MTQLNIKFADGNQLLSYDDDSWCTSGCPTCGYSSEYINQISIFTTNYVIHVEFRQMYEYAFSTADAIRIFAVDLSSMTEEDFIKRIDTKMHKFDALDRYVVKPRNFR